MSKSRSARRKAKLRKRLGFVPQATGKAAHGHGMGFTISTRAHEVHKNKKKEAQRRACRGCVREDI